MEEPMVIRLWFKSGRRYRSVELQQKYCCGTARVGPLLRSRKDGHLVMRPDIRSQLVDKE